jgi:hypothetical protein
LVQVLWVLDPWLRLRRSMPGRHAPVETLVKLGSAKSKVDVSAWEEFFSELVDPIGRSRRAKAAGDLRRGAFGKPRTLASVAIPTHRPGWVLGAVTNVLKAAKEPMQARKIYVAVLELVGEPVSWSSVRNCLASDISGKSPRFERVGHGRYRMATPWCESR